MFDFTFFLSLFLLSLSLYFFINTVCQVKDNFAELFSRKGIADESEVDIEPITKQRYDIEAFKKRIKETKKDLNIYFDEDGLWQLEEEPDEFTGVETIGE